MKCKECGREVKPEEREALEELRETFRCPLCRKWSAKEEQPVCSTSELNDGLCKPPVNAIKAALWWMDAGLKDADMNKGEYELTRGYKEELEEYLTRLA